MLVGFSEPGFSAALGPLAHVVRNGGTGKFGVSSGARSAAILLND